MKLTWDIDVNCAYLYLTDEKEKSERTTELVPDLVFADWNSLGMLIGIEFLDIKILPPDILEKAERIKE